MTLQKQQYSTSFAFFQNIWLGPSRLWIFDVSWKLHKLPSKVDKNEINKCCWTWIFRNIAEIVKAKQIYGYQRHSTGPFHQRKQKKWMLLNICLPPQTQKAIRLAICMNLGQRVVPFLAPFCNLHFLCTHSNWGGCQVNGWGHMWRPNIINMAMWYAVIPFLFFFAK